MRSTRNSDRQGESLISLDTEIERTFHRRLRRQRNMMNGAENGAGNGVAVGANNQQAPLPAALLENHNRKIAQRTMRDFVSLHLQ